MHSTGWSNWFAFHFDCPNQIFIFGYPFTGTVADKIFVASENRVRAFNKKGKLFLTFDSNLTETIRSMYVSGNDLILCGNHVYNHYRDCKEIGSYLCGDNIVDVIVLFSPSVNFAFAIVCLHFVFNFAKIFRRQIEQ